MEIKTSSILGTQHEGEIAVEFAGKYVHPPYTEMGLSTLWINPIIHCLIVI